MKINWQRRPVFVAGLGLSHFDYLPDVQPTEYASKVILQALKDAEMEWKDIQAVFCGSCYLGVAIGHKIIKEVGRIPVTQAVVTVAGNLPYKGVIHGIGPRMGDGNEQIKIEKTIVNCLRLAAIIGWKSVAFPAISTGLFGVPSEVCAEAFKKAVPLFWETFPGTSVKQIVLCLTLNHYDEFERILNS